MMVIGWQHYSEPEVDKFILFQQVQKYILLSQKSLLKTFKVFQYTFKKVFVECKLNKHFSYNKKQIKLNLIKPIADSRLMANKSIRKNIYQ